jgi:hypothetical protein
MHGSALPRFRHFPSSQTKGQEEEEKKQEKRKQTKQNDMHARTSTEIPARTEQPATLKNYFCNNKAGSMQAGRRYSNLPEDLECKCIIKGRGRLRAHS